MNRPPWPLVALLTAAFVAVAVIVVVLVGGDDVAPAALTVNGDTTTSATLDAQLEGFAEGEFFVDAYAQANRTFTVSEGSISATGTVQWLSYLTQTTLAESILADNDALLARSEVDKAQKSLQEQGITTGMSDTAAKQLARFSASGAAVAEALGSYDEYRAAMRRAARKADVSLDPRYGRWSPRRLAFCVPAGCALGRAPVVPPQRSDQSGG